MQHTSSIQASNPEAAVGQVHVVLGVDDRHVEDVAGVRPWGAAPHRARPVPDEDLKERAWVAAVTEGPRRGPRVDQEARTGGRRGRLDAATAAWASRARSPPRRPGRRHRGLGVYHSAACSVSAKAKIEASEGTTPRAAGENGETTMITAMRRPTPQGKMGKPR